MPAQPEKTKVLIVDDIAETRENIKRMLSFEQAIEVIGVARTGREAIEQATVLKPDVIIMDINMPDMDGIQATTEVKRKLPYIQVVILSVQSDPSYMRRAMLSGARDFLTKPPMIDELTEAIKRAGAMAHEERKKASSGYPSNQSDSGMHTTIQQSAPKGRIIGVYSPKGGSGRTTIAVNIAIALREGNHRIALIDGSLQFGDVAVLLNEQGKNTILDLAPRVKELDPDIVQEVMLTHKASGIDVLAAPDRPDFNILGKVSGEAFQELLDYLRRLYEYIIVDTSTTLDQIWAATMDAASIVILVVTQDIPSIKHTSAFLKMAESEGIKRDKFLVVMNKFDKKVNIAAERVGEILHVPVATTIPFDDKFVSNAINSGKPFMIDKKVEIVSRGIQTLADQVKERIAKLDTVEVETPVKK
jgi:pilus assembly protein CpaE